MVFGCLFWQTLDRNLPFQLVVPQILIMKVNGKVKRSRLQNFHRIFSPDASSKLGIFFPPISVLQGLLLLFSGDTVDGWNPVNSPVEVGSLAYNLPTSLVVCWISENQQYHPQFSRDREGDHTFIRGFSTMQSVKSIYARVESKLILLGIKSSHL